MHALDDLAYVAHAGARGGVHLHYIDVAALGDRHAMLAGAAGLDGGPTGAVRPDAVHPLGNNPRRRGFAHATDAGHDEGLRDPVRLEGVFQGAHHGRLPDQVGEGLGPVFSRENLVGFCAGFGHAASSDALPSKLSAPRGRRPPPGAAQCAACSGDRADLRNMSTSPIAPMRRPGETE